MLHRWVVGACTLALAALGLGCQAGDSTCWVCLEAQGDLGPPLEEIEPGPPDPDPACANSQGELTLELSTLDPYVTLTQPSVVSGQVSAVDPPNSLGYPNGVQVETASGPV